MRPAEPRRGVRLAVGIVCAIAVASVGLVARRPPILDLAQQLEQVSLLGEASAGARPDLRIDWLGPNKLGALPIWIGWLAGGVQWGPRLAMFVALALLVGAIHALAAARGRSVASAILAGTFALSCSLYAGFFSFLSGIAAWVFWARELRPDRAEAGFRSTLLRTLAGAMLLYWSHVLWLALGGIAIAIHLLRDPRRRHELAARTLGVLPVLVLAGVWLLGLAGSGWRTTTEMLVSPLERMSSARVVASWLWGGLRGPVELFVLAAFLVWIVAGWAAGLRGRERWDSLLLTLGLTALAVTLLAPDKVDKTIFFAWRWGAVAGIALCLAAPRPRGGRALGVLAASVLALHVGITARAWREFDRIEMSGFESALEAIPAGATVLGLDFEHRSPRFLVDPYFQNVAYSAVERSAVPHFSFLDLGNSLVQRRRRAAEDPELKLLEWHPERLSPALAARFDYLLVHGSEPLARSLEERTGALRRVGGGDRWHTLRIELNGVDAVGGRRAE